MTAILSNTISRYAGNLVGAIAAGTAAPSVTINPAPTKYNGDGTSTFLTEVDVILSPDKSLNYANDIGAEEFSLITGVENADGSATYATSIRGISNISTETVPTAVSADTDWQTTHVDGAPVIIDPTYKMRALDAIFDAGSVINTATTGEAFAIREAVSLHTDGLLYLYHKTNYPNLVGVANAAALITTQLIYTTWGGVSTGHTGLTIGATYYAENTGAITVTPSATTTKLGTAETATTIRIYANSVFVDEASQAQAEGGTVQGVYISPLRNTQQLKALADLTAYNWFLDEDAMGSDSDIKVASQQSIKAYIAAQLATKKTPVIVVTAKKTSDQDNPSGVISFTEVTDVDNEYASNVYTAIGAGLRRFKWIVPYDNNINATINESWLKIELDGTPINPGAHMTGNATVGIEDTVTLCVDLDLTNGQTVELTGGKDSGGGVFRVKGHASDVDKQSYFEVVHYK